MHTQIIRSSSVTEGWLLGSEALAADAWEAFNLIIEVDHSTGETQEDRAAEDMLDGFLARKGLQPVSSVSNSIFPQFYYDAFGADGLFEAFNRNWPRIRAMCHKNRNGHYFRRMTHLEVTRGGNPVVLNPLEHVIGKVRSEGARQGGKRCSYPIAIYQPAFDATRLVGGMGFPCLTTVDFKVERPFLHLNAMYRNQQYVERAYGNLQGLSRLLRFAAEASGLRPGVLTCWATHAELETTYGKREIRQLLSDVRGQLATGARPGAQRDVPAAA